MVVGRGVELDQDLADHAHARLGAVVDQRQRLKGVDRALAQRVERAARSAQQNALGLGHHAVVEGVGGTRLGLVGTHAVEQLHDEVAVEKGVQGLDQKLGLEDVEAGVVLVQAGGGGEADHGHLGVAGVLERLANEGDVVGGAAAATGLGDEHGGAAEVVLAGEHGLHDLASDQDGRVADVVVDVLQAHVDGALVNGGQQHSVEALVLEQLLHQLEVDGAHLRRQDGIAGVLHLLGVAHLLEGGGGGLAVDGHAAGLVLAGALGGTVGAEHALGRDLADLAGSALALQLLALLLEGGHEGANANAGGAEVAHLVDLEHGVDFAGGLQDLLHLVGGQGIKTTTKREELDEVQVIAGGHEARRAVEARVEHPLVDDADGALGEHLVGHGVLGEDGKAEGVHQLGDGVVDLGVVVVGAAGQHDAMGVVLLDPPQGLVTLAVHGVVEVHVGLPGGVDGLVDLGAGDVGATHATAALGGVLLALLADQLVEASLELALLVVRNERVKKLDLGALAQLVDVELQGLRVAHDDGAVVVVGSLLVLLALPADAGHPDEVRVLGDEVHDVAVAKLGRVADGLGGHGLDAGLVGLAVGLVGENDAEAQLGEERVPERVVLVHVEGARNAHGAAGGLLLGEHRTVKEQLVLVLKQVGGVVLGALAGARALLAAVARDEAVALAEVVDGQQAVV